MEHVEIESIKKKILDLFEEIRKYRDNDKFRASALAEIISLREVLRDKMNLNNGS